MRFNRVLRALDRSSRARSAALVGKPYVESVHARDRASAIRWADVALDCGYFDQAHLIRDFRAFAGATPDAFVRSVADVA
jgi:AraC-like DNA-binding protein